MSLLKIEESFRVEAEPERVWTLLVHPEGVVGCLPGASLDETIDERTYRGSVRIGVGPVTVTYRGTAVFEEIDEAGRSVLIVAKGSETGGSGSARMEMRSRVEPVAGGAEVRVRAEVQVTGKIVRFGRGMIERVSHEIFKDFASCLAERLEGAGGAPGEEGSADGADAAGEAAREAAGPVGGIGYGLRALRSWLGDVIGGRRG